MANFNTPGMGVYGSTWQAGGYSGAGNVARLLDSLAGRVAAICGNADTVFDELQQVRTMFSYEKLVVFGVNDVGMYIDRLDHWVTLHYSNLKVWKAVRWAEGRGTHETHYHSIVEGPEVEYAWQGLNPNFPLSGYFAAQVAYLMGADQIILCGCPGSPARRFFEAELRQDFGYGGGPSVSDVNIRQQFVGEMNRVPNFKDRLRSMSGWTREYLGGV